MARSDSRSLAQGAVVETRLCARLLGIRLLVVDGAVTLWPAQLQQPGSDPVLPVSWTEVEPPRPALTSGRAGTTGEDADRALGSRLEATAQRLEASTRRLRELRSARRSV